MTNAEIFSFQLKVFQDNGFHRNHELVEWFQKAFPDESCPSYDRMELEKYTCDGALFHKLREYLLHSSEFTTDEMEMILESISITEGQ